MHVHPDGEGPEAGLSGPATHHGSRLGERKPGDTHNAYDSNTGYLASMTEYASTTPQTVSYAYDAAGRVLSTSRPNGVTTTNTYDPNRGWLNAISNKKGSTELSPWSYTRNPLGDIATETANPYTRRNRSAPTTTRDRTR